ncbi:MAG: GNAT family N-acetyltransferase [Hyphomicrobiales bacterium]|nr:GNAT family N-acetyltransferase [Hyphomicrobiales bacterium]
MTGDRAIRVLTASEVETLVGWAADEGWNPGLNDAAAFRAADPSGFLGAFVGGAMVAGISAVAYGDTFGFIGLYICCPDFRGQGHGKAVWNAGMAHLAGRRTGLDGVGEQVANYARMGFSPAYRTIRHTGRLPGAMVHPSIQPVGADLVAEVAALDRRFFPAPRRSFLAHWLKTPNVALAAMRDGAVVGYAVARPCRQGWKAGPVFATSEVDARNLLSGLAASIGDAEFHLDVPETAREFSAYLVQAGFIPGFTTTRMYTRPVGATNLLQPQATTSLELG